MVLDCDALAVDLAHVVIVLVDSLIEVLCLADVVGGWAIHARDLINHASGFSFQRGIFLKRHEMIKRGRRFVAHVKPPGPVPRLFL